MVFTRAVHLAPTTNAGSCLCGLTISICGLFTSRIDANAYEKTKYLTGRWCVCITKVVLIGFKGKCRRYSKASKSFGFETSCTFTRDPQPQELRSEGPWRLWLRLSRSKLTLRRCWHDTNGYSRARVGNEQVLGSGTNSHVGTSPSQLWMGSHWVFWYIYENKNSRQWWYCRCVEDK